MDDRKHNEKLNLPSHWNKINDKRYIRSDGALVIWDDNLTSSMKLMWTVWEPDPGLRYMPMRIGKNKRFTRPRRFSSPEKAIEACDSYWPMCC